MKLFELCSYRSSLSNFFVVRLTHSLVNAMGLEKSPNCVLKITESPILPLSTTVGSLERNLQYGSQARLETRAMERTVLPRASESRVSTLLTNVGHNDGTRTDGRN
jgi:hypothetical protein